MTRPHINPPYSVYGPGLVEYGENVFVAEHGWLSLPSLDERVRIGDNIQLGRFFTASCVNRIDIGAGCLIAERVFITDTGHLFEDIHVPIMVSGLMEGRPVKIEDDVWIGVGAVILPGVAVGRHSVVAANAVVNRDVPAYSVVAGNPAQVVKTFDSESGVWERTGEQ